jgi:hypothetical protein
MWISLKFIKNNIKNNKLIKLYTKIIKYLLLKKTFKNITFFNL